MAERVASHMRVASSKPQVVHGDDVEVFYPSDVVRLLGEPELDYRQLRRLYSLVREQAGLPIRTGWARFSLRDLAAVAVAVRLARAEETRPDGPRRPRLQFVPVERACRALRERGIENPLLQVHMERSGRDVFAVIDGAVLDPTTGQVALELSRLAVEGLHKAETTQDLADQLKDVLEGAQSARGERFPFRVRIE